MVRRRHPRADFSEDRQKITLNPVALVHRSPRLHSGKSNLALLPTSGTYIPPALVFPSAVFHKKPRTRGGDYRGSSAAANLQVRKGRYVGAGKRATANLRTGGIGCHRGLSCFIDISTVRLEPIEGTRFFIREMDVVDGTPPFWASSLMCPGLTARTAVASPDVLASRYGPKHSRPRPDNLSGC